MTDEQNTPMHVPTPQFRASLENEIIHALRRDARMESDPPSVARPHTRTRRRDRIKLVAILPIGLILGVGTQFASAQVQDARQRTLLERFGSVRALRAASASDIAGLPGFSSRLADQIVSHLRSPT